MANEQQEQTIAALKRAAQQCQYSNDQRALLALADSMADDEDEHPGATLAALRTERDEARAQRDQANERADQLERTLSSVSTEAAGYKSRAAELEAELVRVKERLQHDAREKQNPKHK